MSKPLGIDEVLGLATKTPSFLEKTKIGTQGFFQAHEDPSYKKPSKTITTKAEITKSAIINKEAFDALKDFEKTYDKLKDLNELAVLAEDPKVDLPIKEEKKKESSDPIEQKESMDVAFPTRPIKKEDNNEDKNKIRRGKIQKRGKQTIKDKEKEKRMKGQSSIGSWKSETFMQLRQQFD